MNRIYKVVWSKAKNCYTVVSEIAKRHGKGNRTRTCAAAFLAAFALTGVMGMGEAQAAPDANVYTVNTLNANNNLTVGGIAGNGFYQFFVDSNGAFHAAANKFSVDEDGKVTATEGEIGGVTIKEGNITGVSAINTSAINTNVLNSKYNLSVGTANPNGTMPFFVNSNGAFYAANGKLVVDKDGNVTAGNVVLKNGVFTGNSKLLDGELFVGDASGNYSQITPKSAKLGQVTIDENGNIAGANSIQTNVLNSKYNLSVGTANPNGTMPFFVNSNGAFYAANGKLVVDKDGNVTAGNVVLKNGVFTGNSKLLDGELFVGDASGNYSQITPKSAKLGQVTIDENGNIAGANSIQTNVLNSKYNLSVGTANPNGTMPFFVNSNGAFYAANGKLVVDKDGKVTATEGEIGNVVLKNGVLYKNTALRDGELYVGDADGNYSQITSKNAKLGKVMIDDTGRISGVAAGRIAADSTDAINGSQLHAVQQEAGKHTKVVNGSNITVEETDQDGQKTYKVGLNKNLEGIESISNGDAKINLNDTGVVISKGKDKTFSITDTGMGMSDIGDDYVTRSIMVGKNGTVISGGLSVAGSKITNVAAGSEDTDAVNVGQLKEAVEAGNTDTHIKAGEYGVGTDNKVNMQLVDKNGKDAGTVTITDVAKASDVGDVNNIASDIKNQDGKTTVVDAVNNLNNKVGDLQYSKVEKGEIADGDSTTTAIGKLDQKLTDVAATAAKHTKVEGSSNITVTNTAKEGEAANYKVELKKDIEVNTVNANSVTTGQTVMNKDGLKVGEKVSVTENGLKVGDKVSVTENAVTAGQTSISDAGVKVGENTYISDKGLNANSNKITNVADGEENSDAVNYGQLKKSETTINNRIDGVENQVISNSNRINQLGDRVNKVGAGAAALAALHPLDFDPDDKWDFAAGYGNYSGASAVALGAYYRPNEDTMFSVGGSFGNGENMVNAGVSLKLGQSNHAPTSKEAAMEKKISSLSQEVEELKAAIADLRAAQTKAKDATEKDAQKK